LLSQEGKIYTQNHTHETEDVYTCPICKGRGVVGK
jgi:hypothetical protein